MFKWLPFTFMQTCRRFLKAAKTLLNGLVRYLAHFEHNFSAVADRHIKLRALRSVTVQIR